jgi:carbon monoxide dehydrogenase subunit G
LAIRLENSFVVNVAPQRAWEGLMDVPLVIACMPGAELVDTVGENAWKTNVTVKLGPMTLVFGADVEREEADPEQGRMVMTSKARELKGRGGATARIESTLHGTDGGTQVDIVTDVSLSGTAAQFGRPVVQDVARQLVARFASCLQARLEEDATEPGADTERDPTPAAPAEPLSGVSLLLRALVRPLTRLVRRGR